MNAKGAAGSRNLSPCPHRRPASADRLKNIVLVHGTWLDGLGWRPVLPTITGEVDNGLFGLWPERAPLK